MNALPIHASTLTTQLTSSTTSYNTRGQRHSHYPSHIQSEVYVRSFIIQKSITGAEPRDIELDVTYIVPKCTYRTSHNTKFTFTYFKQ